MINYELKREQHLTEAAQRGTEITPTIEEGGGGSVKDVLCYVDTTIDQIIPEWFPLFEPLILIEVTAKGKTSSE